MKNIHKDLNSLLTKGYYYKLIITPDRIDLKLYLEKDNIPPEVNYNEENTEDGRNSLRLQLRCFVTNLS